jgi:hypothetical protein
MPPGRHRERLLQEFSLIWMDAKVLLSTKLLALSKSNLEFALATTGGSHRASWPSSARSLLDAEVKLGNCAQLRCREKLESFH